MNGRHGLTPHIRVRFNPGRPRRAVWLFYGLVMSSRRTGKSPRASRASAGWSLQHRPQTPRRRAGGGGDYSTLSRSPLHSLIFLLPLVVAYEIGTRLYLNDPAMSSVQSIRAHSMLLAFFQDFGVAGRFLPAITVIAVLAVWHVLNSDRTKIRPQVLAGMVLESMVLTVPLIVFIGLMQLTFGAAHATAAVQFDPSLGQVVDPLATLSWRAGLTISIGAGLYEEMLFRMVGITALHLVCVDLAKMSERVGTALAVALCAAAFAAYHDVMGPGGQIDVLKAASLMVAGMYFGLIFSVRGFGLAVGVHVLYDVYVLVLSRPSG